MSDDEEDACPLCILPYSEQDASFTPCPCGFKICVWCWHKIIDIAGSVSENSLDQVGQCPHCRTPFDVEAVLDQQRKQAATKKGKGGLGDQPAGRAKRKAVTSKQPFADTVVVDGKTISLENVPGTVFLPAVLSSLGEYLTGIDTPDNTARKFLLNKLEALKEEKRKKAQGQQSQKKLTKRQKKSLADAENGEGAEDDEAGELEEEVFTEDDSDCFSEDGDGLAGKGPLLPPVAPKGKGALGYNSAAVGVSSKGALDGLDVPESANFNRVAALCLSRRELSQGEATSEASSKLAKDVLPLPLLRCLRDVRAVLRALLTQDKHAEEVGRILTGEALLPTYTTVIAKPALDEELRKMLEDDAIQRNVHARSASVASAGTNPNVSSRVSGSQETSVSNILQDITNMAIYQPHLLAASTTDVLYYNNPFFDRCWAKLFLREDAADDSKVPDIVKPATPAAVPGAASRSRPLATKAAPMPLDGGFNDGNGTTAAAASVDTQSSNAADSSENLSSFKDDEVAALASILAPYDLSYLEENIDALATQASRQWVKGTNNAVDLRGVLIDCDGAVGSNNTNVSGNAHNRVLLNNAYFNAKARLLLERRRMNYRMWVRLCVQGACTAQAYASTTASGESSSTTPSTNLNYETLQMMLRTLTSFSTATVGVDGEVASAANGVIPAIAAPPLAPKQSALWLDALLRSQEHTVPVDRLLLFGKILCHYVSKKETNFLSNEERLELLQQQSMIGRFGHVTDGQFFAVPYNHPPCPPSSASSPTEGSAASEESLAVKIARKVADTFSMDVNTQELLPRTGTLIRHYHRYTYGGYLKVYFEELNAAGIPKNAPNVTGAALSLLPIAGYESASSSPQPLISSVLPSQRYTVILRFSSVAEAVACVASGVEQALLEGMVPASSSSASGTSQSLFRFAASPSPTASSTTSQQQTPRIKVGLVPTRYCSQFLKNSMCEKYFCTEIHQECQFNQQTTISSSNPKIIVSAIQEHFFASAMTVAASSIGSKPSFSRQGSTTDLSHHTNQSPLGFAGLAGSTVTGPPVVRGVPAGALVGNSQPLLLKHIKGAEYSVVRNDFVTPAPEHMCGDATPIADPSAESHSLRITAMSRHFEAEKTAALHRYVLGFVVKYQQQLLIIFKAPDTDAALPTLPSTSSAAPTVLLKGTGKILMLEKADKSASSTTATTTATATPISTTTASTSAADIPEATLPAVLMPSQLLCNPNTDGYAHDKGCLSPVAKGGYNYMDPTLPSEFGHSASLAHTVPAWALALAADVLTESEGLLGKYETYLSNTTTTSNSGSMNEAAQQQRDFVQMTLLTLGRQLGLSGKQQSQQPAVPQSKRLLAHFWDTLASLAASYKDGGNLPPMPAAAPPTTTTKGRAGGSAASRLSANATPAKRTPTTTSSDIYSQRLVGEELNARWLDTLSTTPTPSATPTTNDSNTPVADGEMDLHTLMDQVNSSTANLATLSVVLRQFIADSFLREIPTLSTAYYTVAGDDRIRGVAAARGMSTSNIEKLIARMVVLNQGTLIFLGRLAAVVQQLLDLTMKIKGCFDQYELIRYLVPLERAKALAGVVSGGGYADNTNAANGTSTPATPATGVDVRKNSNVSAEPSDMGDSTSMMRYPPANHNSGISGSLGGSVSSPTGGMMPSKSTSSNPWGKQPVAPPSPITGLNDSGSGFPPTPTTTGSWGVTASPAPIHDDPWATLTPKKKVSGSVWGETTSAPKQQSRAPESMADKLAKKFSGGPGASSPSGPPNPVGSGLLGNSIGASGISTPTSPDTRRMNGGSFGGIQPIDSCLNDDDASGASFTGGMLGSRTDSNIYGTSTTQIPQPKSATNNINKGQSPSSLSTANVAAHSSGNGALRTTVNVTEVVSELPTGVKVATQSLVALGSKVLFGAQSLRHSLLTSHEDYMRALSTTVTTDGADGGLKYQKVIKGWLATLAITETDVTMHNIFVPALRMLFRRYLAFDLLRHAAVASPTILNLIALQSVEAGLLATRAASTHSITLSAMFAVSTQYAIAESTNRLDLDRGGTFYYSRSLHRGTDGQYSSAMLSRLKAKGVCAIRAKCSDSVPNGLIAPSSTQVPQTEAHAAAKKLLDHVEDARTVPFQAPLLLTLFPEMESSPPAGPTVATVPTTKPFADERAPPTSAAAAAARRPVTSTAYPARGRGGGGGKYN